MENWGLITYREAALLLDPANSSAQTKQWVAVCVAHEIAHQWYVWNKDQSMHSSTTALHVSHMYSLFLSLIVVLFWQVRKLGDHGVVDGSRQYTNHMYHDNDIDLFRHWLMFLFFALHFIVCFFLVVERRIRHLDGELRRGSFLPRIRNVATVCVLGSQQRDGSRLAHKLASHRSAHQTCKWNRRNVQSHTHTHTHKHNPIDAMRHHTQTHILQCCCRIGLHISSPSVSFCLFFPFFLFFFQFRHDLLLQRLLRGASVCQLPRGRGVPYWTRQVHQAIRTQKCSHCWSRQYTHTHHTQTITNNLTAKMFRSQEFTDYFISL